MNYKLTWSSAEEYLRVCIDGAWPAEGPNDIISEIYNLWSTHRANGILIDIRNMEGKPSVLGDYKDAEFFYETGFYRVKRIAVMDKLNRQEENDFFETTANNRGLRWRFFYADEKEAINWLLAWEQDRA